MEVTIIFDINDKDRKAIAKWANEHGYVKRNLATSIQCGDFIGAAYEYLIMDYRESYDENGEEIK